jgi:TatD DNase family protein
MIPLMDTHAHMSDSSFDADREEVLERAAMAGVGCVVTVSETLEDCRRNLELADATPYLVPAAGLYPAHLDREQAEQTVAFIRGARHRLAAVGEVGLDHWVVKGEEEREIQREIFGLFADLARELDLPLNVHSRSAGRHAVSLLLERGARRVQLHAFDGKLSSALPAVEAGYFFSVPPSVVRSRQKQKLVRGLPLRCLLLETDSPVLGPVSGDRNEPCNLEVSLRVVSEIKGVSREEVREQIAENTRLLYGEWAPGMITIRR